MAGWGQGWEAGPEGIGGKIHQNIKKQTFQKYFSKVCVSLVDRGLGQGTGSPSRRPPAPAGLPHALGSLSGPMAKTAGEEWLFPWCCLGLG